MELKNIPIIFDLEFDLLVFYVVESVSRVDFWFQPPEVPVKP